MGTNGYAAHNRRFLGIDSGSVAVGLILTDDEGNTQASYYAPHGGNPREAVLRGIERLDFDTLAGVAITGSSLGTLPGVNRFDSVVCTMASTRSEFRGADGLLFVGGERFGLVRFDEEGNYHDLKSSTSCAAGSGSFLDQQALRLGLSGAAELAASALSNTGKTPDIASRCSVFAKTDIIHAQALGHSLAEICDGLCLGLARNIYNTVMIGRLHADGVYCFAGGVALNAALVKHLETVSGIQLAIGAAPQLCGAHGACLEYLRTDPEAQSLQTKERLLSLVRSADEPKEYVFGPLPDTNHSTSRNLVPSVSFEPGPVDPSTTIEITSYRPASAWVGGKPIKAAIGIDVGSTSTKLAVMAVGPIDPADRPNPTRSDPLSSVLYGLYTKTGGQPFLAVRNLFAQLERLCASEGLDLKISSVATTGSGRKFIGKLIGADLVVDEISAHARAAYEIAPETDTIIEIGGQDSKFTLLRDGRVTFCQMNTVCAAGTGSFLEEQAARLHVPLTEFERLAVGVRAPLTSDRCTVFMERDINAYLRRGFNRREMLAATARSVCENYLAKVAVEGSIGDHISFQGATARNGALVAAFEERLGKRLLVSQMCHITGAVGAALYCLDERRSGSGSAFRGLGLWQSAAEIRTEECRYCANRCTIRVAEIDGEKVAYGFACGRDYATHHYVAPSEGYDLETQRSQLIEESFVLASTQTAPEHRIGIPDALLMHEELPFWRQFFGELGFRTVTAKSTGIEAGREVAGADFCAPMVLLHAQVDALARSVDWIFLPVSVGRHPAQRLAHSRRDEKFCYYTQFGSSLAAIIGEGKASMIAPVFRGSDSLDRTVDELVRCLGPLLGRSNRRAVERAYRKAAKNVGVFRRKSAELLVRELAKAEAPSVLLLGRPYVVFSPEMNKGIPRYFASLGVRAFYQDMVPVEATISPESEPLVARFHWHYSVEMLRAAEFAARTPGLYPVLLTAFRCSPDSFAIQYFTRLLDRVKKPYLVLQLDEHESGVGYETRIEAAIRSFRNHLQADAPPTSPGDSSTAPRPPRRTRRARVERLPNPRGTATIDGRTLLLPNWDPLSCPLLAANLRRVGFDARVLHEDEGLIRKAMRFNTGQCVPLNIIVEEFVHYVKTHDLDPDQTSLWMPKSELACNLPLFAPYMRTLLERYEMGAAQIYEGEIYYLEISPLVALRAYFAYLAGGMLRRLGCRTRPYEATTGATDRVIGTARSMLIDAFEGKLPLGETLSQTAGLFETVELKASASPRPKVALFGDLYVRDNEVFNNNLIGTIESAGGEVVTTPYNEYLKIVGRAYFKSWVEDRKFTTYAEYRALLAVVEAVESRFSGLLKGYPLPRLRDLSPDPELGLARFHMRLQQEGESFDNVLKILHLLRAHPDLSLFVQASPAFCCPSLVTEAMSATIQELTGIPVVTITYDGTGDIKNDLVVPYLAQPRRHPRKGTFAGSEM